jgi:signal transduction histidine kinase
MCIGPGALYGPGVAEHRLAKVPIVDAVTALALLLASQVEVWAPRAMVGTGAVDGSKPLLAATAAVGTVALAFRRVMPLASCLLVFGAWGVQGLLTTPTEGLTALICLMLSAYSVAAYSVPMRAGAGLVAAVMGIAALSSDLANGVFALVLVAAAWIAGFALRRRRVEVRVLNAHAEALELDRDDAIARERGRIARELHDVVSHHVMTTVVQAQAGRAHLGDDDAVRRSLDAIDASGRAALAELRTLLGLLRASDPGDGRSPQPGLGDVPALVARAAEAGVPVALRVDGDPESVPPGVSLAAYRVAQEALTNVLKHGAAAATDVSLDIDPEGVLVRVADRGPGRADGSRTGHGLIGMRERAALYGGTVTATDREDGGFVVEAWFPREVPR